MTLMTQRLPGGWVLSCVFLISYTASAQTYNFNIGGGPGFPLNHTGDFANTSYNFVVGGGLNVMPHVKFVGEFMFHGLPLKRSVLDQAHIPIGKGRLYALTGNVLIGTGNDSWGVYLVGGGGWYRRTVEAQKEEFQAGEICGPVLVWWNVQCVNGVFRDTVTIASSTSSAPGFNIGGGFTRSLWDSRINFYTEVRYHRAWNNKVDTTVLPLTFGIRF